MRNVTPLLRLSELRADQAERKLQKARLDIAHAEAQIEAAREAQRELHARIIRQREEARELFVGATHSRVAVENMLLDLTGFDKAEETAAKRIDDAIEARDALIPPLTEARQALLKARAKVDKRARLVAQMRVKMQHEQELAEEAEAEEQWLASRRCSQLSGELV